MKVIFLDFDGVLNSQEFMRRVPQSGTCGLDDVAVTRLLRLVRITDAKIVVSSTWRRGRTLDELRDVLGAVGLPKSLVIGKTPTSGPRRGNEIQTWLDNAPLFDVRVDNFVILDDDSDMEHLSYALVKTKFENGLTDEDVDSAVKVLSMTGIAV